MSWSATHLRSLARCDPSGRSVQGCQNLILVFVLVQFGDNPGRAPHGCICEGEASAAANAKPSDLCQSVDADQYVFTTSSYRTSHHLICHPLLHGSNKEPEISTWNEVDDNRGYLEILDRQPNLQPVIQRCLVISNSSPSSTTCYLR